MKIGDKVKVIATDRVWGDFFGMVGTITNEFVTVIDVHKFVVKFDEPFYDEGLENWSNNPFIDSYDFPDDCLELV